MMAKLFKMIVNLAVLAALGWAAWYGYTGWVAASSDSGTAADTGGYNCRLALAKLAQDYQCRDDANCTLSQEELAALKEREMAIEKNCN
jgi:hypothetical protein